MAKNNNITFIHIMAALMVILGHEYVLLGYEAPKIFGFSIHTLGVRTLFLISGLLVSRSYIRNNNCFVFWTKRLWRLYPSFVVCVILTVLILFPLDTAGGYWKDALKNIYYGLTIHPLSRMGDVFISNPYPGSINGSLWTLPIEIACYLFVVPVINIYKYIKSHNRHIANCFVISFVASLSLISAVLNHMLTIQHLVFYGTDWTRGLELIVFFFIGTAFCLMEMEKYCDWQSSIVLLVVSISLFWKNGFLCSLIMPFIIGYFLLTFATAKPPRFEHVIKRDICYGLYLYAFPVQQLLIYFIKVKFRLNIPTIGYFFVSLLFIWSISEITYCLIEEPFAILWSRMTNRSRS